MPGYDWLLVETEHNGMDTADVQHMLMAMNGTDTIPLVRVPPSDPVFIQRALDIGALGLMVPLVKTAAEAQDIVSATRLPPEGRRSLGPLRASNYTFDNEDYYNRVNDNILVALILETKEAVDNLEEIAAVPGIDALYIGQWDLSLALGLNPLRLPHPEVEAVIERALEVGRKSGVAIGNGARTPEDLRSNQARGFTFLSYGPDYGLLAAAARAGVEAFER